MDSMCTDLAILSALALLLSLVIGKPVFVILKELRDGIGGIHGKNN